MSTVTYDPEKNMDFWYSSERWKDVLVADEAETIRVPPCLDVLKIWKRNDLDEAPHFAPNISGQKGEAAFVLKFQELNMGGILVSGLESCDLVANKTVPKQIIQKGEWDAIFFHQNRGIFAIEVKAIETDDKDTVDNRIKKVKTQLDKNIENIKQSFHSLYQKEYACITGFICFPFRNEDRDTYEGYKVIDKSALNDPAIFRQFFEPQANERMTEVSLLRSFVAEFVCCRSKVEFHSQAYNAMQVATWIMEQDIAQKQNSAKLVIMPGNGASGKIILTAQQLEIVECREKCVTIRGAPGSGKTLILMIRTLKAAMENKAGSVFVFVNEKLKAKYEQYFFEERGKIFVDDAHNIDRTPNVQTIDKINFAKPEDDVFFDETPVEDSYIEKVESRVNCSGSTTVVFTGLHKPGEAVASFRLYRPRLKQFKHFELLKVLRGTGNIFREWGHYYPPGITIGHNIYGLAVKSNNFDSFEQVQNEIANKIATLTNTNYSNACSFSFKKDHIAVITCDENDSTEIRNYFDTVKIPCGEVDEQVRRLMSASIVAVDYYLNTPSYEWPIVFIVLKPGVTKKEVLPIAASRCIASLTIFTYKNANPSSIKADELQPTKGEVFGESKLAPLASSYSTSQSDTEDWQPQLENTQQSLKESYSKRFRKVYPFSLPFTFDIENTWVSLALKDDVKNSQATEDHAQLLKTAFETANMLIIEGNPATGKTSLMRRLAYEWAKGKQELIHNDLVLYAEFRDVREKKFEKIMDLVLHYSKTHLPKENYEKLEKVLKNEQFCEKLRLLVLLDGYDESLLERQCSDLKKYLFDSIIDKALVFNVVITTRKGYLSNLRGREGRFIFAEVLGFPTKRQKDIYISKHFLSAQIDYKNNIAAVHRLLSKNKNLNKIAATPLFLTFMCLVHEKIIEGTLVELYCNIIWWLIDRYQQGFPDCDIPALFGFQNDSSDKFKTIQDHYLHFPQLHRVAEMALRNLEMDVIEYTEYEKFDLQPIIEQVGLLRKEEKHDNSFKLVTSYFFPHRTIQEFLAAFYYFYSDDQTNSTPTNSKLTMKKMNEFQKFLLRISLSDKIPVNMDKRKNYFEGLKDLIIDITFDAFNTTTGSNNKLLDCLTSKCVNMQNFEIHRGLNNSASKRNSLKTKSESAPIQLSFRNCASLLSSKIQNCKLYANSQLIFNNCPSFKTMKFIACISKSSTLNFEDLLAIDTVEFKECTFEANSQLSFINCPSLKNMIFSECTIRSTTIGFVTLLTIDTMEFEKCKFKASSQLSFTNCPTLTNMIFRECEISSTMFDYAASQVIDTVEFIEYTSEANSQLSFIDCPSLKNMEFRKCKISSSDFGFATLPAIDTVEFFLCDIDSATWQSITDQIRNSSVKCLKFSAEYFIKRTNPEFLHHLQKCEHIEEIHVTDIYDNDSNVNDYILYSCEKAVTANLAQIAQKLLRLKSIILDVDDRKLREGNEERIKKAGQERNPNFSIKYVK